MSLFVQFTDFIFPFSFKKLSFKKEVKETFEKINLNLDLYNLLNNFSFKGVFKDSQIELGLNNKTSLCDKTLKYLTFLSVTNNCQVSKKIVNDYYLNKLNLGVFKYIKIEDNEIFGSHSDKSKWNKIKISKLCSFVKDDVLIQNFITNFKNLLNISKINYDIKVVSGEEITFWYSEKNYHKDNFFYDGPKTVLGKSCMRNSKQGYSPKLYEHNHEKVNMLIVTENGKLKGRALLWRLDNGQIFMDRCYYLNEEIEKLMYLIGFLNGFIVKLHYINRYWNGTRIVEYLKLKTTINNLNNIKYPYLDTFNRDDLFNQVAHKKSKILLTN